MQGLLYQFSHQPKNKSNRCPAASFFDSLSLQEFLFEKPVCAYFPSFLALSMTVVENTCNCPNQFSL